MKALELIKKLRSGRVLVLAAIEAVLLLVHHFGGPKVEMDKIVPGFDTIMSALELFVAPLLATGAAHHAPQPAEKSTPTLPSIGILFSVLLLSGCTVEQKQKARTAVDFAYDAAKIACVTAFGEAAGYDEEKIGVKFDELAGKFCDNKDKLRPFLDGFLAGKAAAAAEVGLQQ